MKNLLSNVEKRNKAVALVVGLVVLFFGTRAGVDVEQLVGAVTLLVVYILGDAYQNRV